MTLALLEMNLFATLFVPVGQYWIDFAAEDVGQIVFFRSRADFLTLRAPADKNGQEEFSVGERVSIVDNFL